MSLTSGMYNPMSRFGFHKEYLLKHSPNYKNQAEAECYIPTRLEVFQNPMEKVEPILRHWFQDAPEPLIPSCEQRNKVITLLRKRPDASKFADAINNLERL